MAFFDLFSSNVFGMHFFIYVFAVVGGHFAMEEEESTTVELKTLFHWEALSPV